MRPKSSVFEDLLAKVNWRHPGARNLLLRLDLRPEVKSMGLSHLPVSLHRISEDDKKTYRKWARISGTCYVGLAAGLLLVGLWTRQPKNPVVTEHGVGSGSIANPAVGITQVGEARGYKLP